MNQLSLPWFDSYLRDRRQHTLVNSTASCFQSITYGVPQGSCLGPLFFLDYINDLVDSLGTANAFLFADDTVLFQTAQDMTELESKLQSTALKLESWCIQNLLVINTKKSKVMLFQLAARVSPKLSIILGNDVLDQVQKYTYLGFVLDNRLPFNSMFASLSGKLNHLAFILAKVRPYLTTKAAALVFKSKFISYLD